MPGRHHDNLDYSIEEWHGERLLTVLARAGHIHLATAAYWVAIWIRPIGCARVRESLAAFIRAAKEKRNHEIRCYFGHYTDTKYGRCDFHVARLHNQLFNQENLATPRGFEPPTYRLGICRSIRLSYGAAWHTV